MFPRKYASGADFNGKAVTLTIALVRTEKMRPQPGAPEQTKYVVYFKDATKGVILCKTLAYEIAKAIGCDENEDVSNWIGKKVTLYPQPMKVAGKDRIAIRARKPTAGNGVAPPPTALSDEEDL
jgi:hypothetical protein